MNVECRLRMVMSIVVLTAAASAPAHVLLLAPDGGEVLEAGGVATIEWSIVVGHDTQNWDLWYSTTGADGPFLPIEIDLPPGQITTGSQHSYQWTVPEVFSDRVRVRVVQDNTGTDYLDDSNADLTIQGLLAADFETGDFSGWSSVVAP